jgi:hypothetical protein
LQWNHDELAKIWNTAHPTPGRPKRLSDQGMKITSSKRTTLKGDPRPSARRPPGNGGNRDALSMQFQNHHQLSKSNHRRPLAQRT